MYAYIAFIGIILILAGFMLLFLYTLLSAGQQQKSSVNVGGVVMIGPVPIIFGTSQGIIIVAEILAIVLIILAILFFFLFSRR